MVALESIKWKLLDYCRSGEGRFKCLLCCKQNCVDGSREFFFFENVNSLTNKTVVVINAF